MNVNGKIYLFKNVRKNAEGKESFYYLSTISRKVNDEVQRMHINVEFAKDNFPEATLNKLQLNVCYTLELEEAFLSFTSGKDGKKYIYLKIMKAKIVDKKKVDPIKSVKKQDDELPF